jgi:pyruvate formate lyase activating enzyme
MTADISLRDPFTVPGRFWHRLDDGRVQCDVCPRECRLHEGQRGLCFVRGRVDDQVVLTSYGRSSGFCVDPIEKKPLNHFLPGSAVLSFGTAGCNLSCKFCQNWDISKSREIERLSDAAGPDDIAAAAERLGCRSVAMTYNDPTIFLEYAVDVADACRARGSRPSLVTAGYVNDDARRELYAHVDAANVDLKAFTDDFYRRVSAGPPAAGARHPAAPAARDRRVVRDHHAAHPGAQRLRQGDRRRVRVDRREPGDRRPAALHRLPPGLQDARRPAHPAGDADARPADRPATGCASSTRATCTTPRGGRTTCPACGEVVVERDWYVIGRYRLTDDGRCASCGAAVPGRYDGPVGRWGARRLPVSLAGS